VLAFRILGPLEAVSDDGAIPLGGLKQRSALAILLLSANRVVSVERLAEDLYAGAPPVTAVTQVQRQISALRKTLGPQAGIETRAPGYVIRVAPEQLDLNRFERATEDAAGELARGEAAHAAELLRDALALWRGAPLADLGYESFAQTTIGRLEEIRLAALELRIDADLALGRHTLVVPELESLVAEHPLRERLSAQLMLALYRSGRQADALEAYGKARAALVEGFGLEPSPALHALERAILVHDPSLDLRHEATGTQPQPELGRAVLVLPSATDRLRPLLTVAEPLARLPGRELIVARLLPDDHALDEAAAELSASRATLDVPVRTAAFTTLDPSRDTVRLATIHDVELVLLDASTDVEAARLATSLSTTLERSPADVGLLAGATVEWGRGAGVYLPFGGGEHDWAALELGARLASATGARLRLVGTKADARHARRDASRLLADASLAVQRVVGIDAEPLLAHPDEEGLVQAVADATIVITGISPRWRAEGIGAVRRALVGQRSPVLIVHAGRRPGVLSPDGNRTRFSWSLEP
jgi:DNA-binding SARP family transcriptional activator